jgi:hypothetical protein
LDVPKDRIDPEDEGGEAPCWAHLDLDADDPAVGRDDRSCGADPCELPDEDPRRRPAASDATS